MTIPFEAFYARLSQATDIASQMDLARALGVNRSAVTQAKNRNAVPQKWVLTLSRQFALSPDWLEFGQGRPRASTSSARDTLQRAEQAFSFAASGEIIAVPKVRARLCAGGGSLELEAAPVSEHPFPRSWLSRMGTPGAMVFMDVVGDSMEPGIADGDMVLVDQAYVQITPKSVMAVGYEDSIYIKRLENRPGGITLLSDNPDYAPIAIAGDEMSSFRVIGRVVWLCRDCRHV